MAFAPVPAVKLTKNEIAYLARHVGITGIDVALTVAIAWIESGGGFTNIYRPAAENPLGGQDTGLMQVNSRAWPGHDPVELLDPFNNLRVAKGIFTGSSGWGPWNYGPKAYGLNLNPPRPARTDAAINLADAQIAASEPVNPYWRMVDAGMNVYDLPVPATGSYASRLPLAPLKYGDSDARQKGLGDRISQLQQILVEMRLFTGTTDRYYGPRVRAGITGVQAMLADCGLWPTDQLDGQYSIELFNVWDGALQFDYMRRGR